MTTVRLLRRNGTRLKVQGLDALDGTPVIDIKPFYPQYDTPKGSQRVPEYIFRLKY